MKCSKQTGCRHGCAISGLGFSMGGLARTLTGYHCQAGVELATLGPKVCSLTLPAGVNLIDISIQTQHFGKAVDSVLIHPP